MITDLFEECEDRPSNAPPEAFDHRRVRRWNLRDGHHHTARPLSDFHKPSRAPAETHGECRKRRERSIVIVHLQCRKVPDIDTKVATANLDKPMSIDDFDKWVNDNFDMPGEALSKDGGNSTSAPDEFSKPNAAPPGKNQMEGKNGKTGSISVVSMGDVKDAIHFQAPQSDTSRDSDGDLIAFAQVAPSSLTTGV